MGPDRAGKKRMPENLGQIIDEICASQADHHPYFFLPGRGQMDRLSLQRTLRTKKTRSTQPAESCRPKIVIFPKSGTTGSMAENLHLVSAP